MMLGIEGAYLRNLPIVRNEKGVVREFVRADDTDFPGFGQVHVVETNPGVVRAWFRHRFQYDQISCIAGMVRVGLYDDRPLSPTRGSVIDKIISADTPTLLIIPPMVWHGFTTLGESSSVLIQQISQAFKHAEPDEEKRPIDDPIFPFVW